MTAFPSIRLAGLILLGSMAPAIAQDLTLGDKLDLKRLCGADIASHCGDVEPGGGRIRTCLSARLQDFSEPCRQLVERLELLPPDNPQPDSQG